MRRTIKRGMDADVGWDASAAGYAALYHSLI
jgi:glycogen synthase